MQGQTDGSPTVCNVDSSFFTGCPKKLFLSKNGYNYIKSEIHKRVSALQPFFSSQNGLGHPVV